MTAIPKNSLPRFAVLWSSYPNSNPCINRGTREPPKGHENQCAIKLSIALALAGIKLTTFQGATVSVNGERVAVRAQELAAWLEIGQGVFPAGKAHEITGPDGQRRISAKTGIVYSSDYWLRPGETKPSVDHIDLWNGSRLTASGLAGALVTMARFGLNLRSGPGFSDLGKAGSILFWEIT